MVFLNWIDAACEGCGFGSKMILMAPELSEYMRMRSILGFFLTYLWMSSAAWARAYISASKFEALSANLTDHR